jgi:hypothetical protein
MLDFLRDKRRRDRQVRLFICACARSLWTVLTHEECRRAVEVAELYADGLATDQERKAANEAISTYFFPKDVYADADIADDVASMTIASFTNPFTPESRNVSFDLAAESLGRASELTGNPKSYASLLRDIIGNPFSAATVNRSWLAWNAGAVAILAQSMYDDRAFDRLPILADALEDAGCTNQDILSHCRSGGEHGRGCWVVDLLLGKE